MPYSLPDIFEYEIKTLKCLCKNLILKLLWNFPKITQFILSASKNVCNTNKTGIQHHPLATIELIIHLNRSSLTMNRRNNFLASHAYDCATKN